MLVLSRNVGEAILVNQNIKIIVLKTRGEQVKLGIEAPVNVKVLRCELLEKQNGQETIS